MFESLRDRLGGVFDRLGRRGALKADDVREALREIRVALLEADVALPVAKSFIEKVEAEAVGEKTLRGINPAQQVIKIVHDALVETLGGDMALDFAASPPVVYLMVGLQGSGKTTTTGKLGRHLKNKERKKVLMASLDTQRPAAQEQLEILGKQVEVATLPIVKGQKPKDIAKRALDAARKEGFDILLLDTAGRLSIDDELMTEVAEIRDLSKPLETLLVADALTGQDAVNTARNFSEKIGLTGIVLTRMDGDARGGAALSMRAVTGKPVKLIGTGEQMDALQAFDAERIAGRILDMGDVVALVEKAAETIEREEAEKMARKMQKGEFDLDDFASQLRQMKKMGGFSGMLGLLPGMGKMKAAIENANLDDSVFKRQEAIISSMTQKERRKPETLNASRRKRIAAGSGTEVQDVNRLMKQFMDMQTMMKRLKKMGGGGLMEGMAKMFGGGAPQDMPAMPSPDENLLGPNPFDTGAPSSLPPSPFGGGMGMPPGFGMPPGLGGFGNKNSATKSPLNKRKKAQLERRMKEQEQND